MASRSCSRLSAGGGGQQVRQAPAPVNLVDRDELQAELGTQLSPGDRLGPVETVGTKWGAISGQREATSSSLKRSIPAG